MSTTIKVTRRTWRERLFTRPWQPLRATNTVIVDVPPSPPVFPVAPAVWRKRSDVRRDYGPRTVTVPNRVRAQSEPVSSIDYSSMAGVDVYHHEPTQPMPLRVETPRYESGGGGDFGGAGATGSWGFSSDTGTSSSSSSDSSSCSCDAGSYGGTD
jgi:hypothetical protein